jgi:TRAP-type C4-dicarboxylate transport system permease large subunit
VVAGVARDVPLHLIFRGALHMLYAMLALAVLLLVFPQLATFLPQLIR